MGNSVDFNYENHLVLDGFNTWPESLINLLTKHTKELSEYLKEEERFDKLSETDVMLRINRPVNPREEFWLDKLSQTRKIIRSWRIIGFHCTRLANIEIDEIRTSGLQPLSYKFSLQRIKNIQSSGLIKPSIAKELIQNNKINDSARNGKVAFFHCLSTFRRESGIYRLLRSWGGEALYWYHENNPDVYSVLKNIGTPCIVVGSLKIPEISYFPALEERIISIWLDKNNSNAYSQDIDTFIKRPVKVLEIIPKDDHRFEALTKCSMWRFKI